jgi:hypothetical protein
MVIDLHHDEEQIRLVNIYHSRPERGHALHHIFSSTLDPLIPTAVFRDFNTHSPLWSIPNATPSAWVPRLVDWLMDQGLDLLNEPGLVTWNGRKDQLASVLNLSFLNEAAMASDQFSLYSVSFEESVGSDHAASLLTWYPETSLALVPPPAPVGFVVDDILKDSWIKKFCMESCPDIDSIPSLDDAAEKLHHDINATSASLFSPRKAPDPRGVQWWSIECSAASSLVCQASPGMERMKANKELRRTIKNAKRQWAHDFLDHATVDNLWAAARWRRGRSNSCIPPLISANSTLTQDPAGQAAALGSRFFDASPPPVDPSQPDDPPPRPVREWPPIINDEIKVALTGTSNGSAPGRSGINYKLLKWAFEASPPRFTSLFNAALSLGHHPWKDAKVVVLPKPGKPNYSMPKAYRPISLLECCGKLLEKIIATRVLAEVNEHDLIPPNQFGSRDYHCAADAALIVAHNAQACITSHHVGALILFDIQGFFDNVNVERAARVFQDLGFPPQFCTWICSFLTG